MSQYFCVHPDNPQLRLIRQAVAIVESGGVLVYPTDSVYAIGCAIGAKRALERISRIRQLDKQHHFSLLCRDLSELGQYAQVDNSAFRLIKSLIPGPYTFILRATKEVPKRFQHTKRKTIGLRVPQCQITQLLLEELAGPMMSTTLQLPNEQNPEHDPELIRERLEQCYQYIVL